MTALFEHEDELEKLAKSGDIDARYWEGMWCHHTGLQYESSFQQHPNEENTRTVMDSRYQEAVKWWRPLAETGVVYPQWNLGTLYAHGRGVPKSPSNAIDLYYKAGVQFRKANDREHALVVLDNMRETDETNPLTKKLCRSLYPGE
jgi:TPR repeat protein